VSHAPSLIKYLVSQKFNLGNRAMAMKVMPQRLTSLLRIGDMTVGKVSVNLMKKIEEEALDRSLFR
jgi:hypothetical protein